MWRALELRRAWRAARAAHGECTTVVIAKMLELAAPDPGIIVSFCSALMLFPLTWKLLVVCSLCFAIQRTAFGVSCKVNSLAMGCLCTEQIACSVILHAADNSVKLRQGGVPCAVEDELHGSLFISF